MWQSIWNWRDKTFLFLIQQHEYKRQESLARRLPHIHIINWRDEFLLTAQPEQKYLNLSVQGELDRIKMWSESNPQSILCIVDTDYALMRLTYEHRQMFWRGLWSDFPYSKSIILYTVLNSLELLPDNFEQWETSKRIIRP